MALRSIYLSGENWINDENEIRVAIQSKMVYLENKTFYIYF